jgi:hypothetical protein
MTNSGNIWRHSENILSHSGSNWRHLWDNKGQGILNPKLSDIKPQLLARRGIYQQCMLGLILLLNIVQHIESLLCIPNKITQIL